VSLHLQMIGRCLRPQPGKQAVILDHVGNYQRLGHHLEEREWTLDGRIVRAKDAAPSVKVCPSCFAAMASAARVCPECGHEFVPERRELQHVDGELVELKKDGVFKVGDLVRPKMLQGEQFEIYHMTSCGFAWLRRPGQYVPSGDGCGSYAISALSHWVEPDPRREQAEAGSLQELIAVGQRRGMKNPAGWARHVMAARSLRTGRSRVREVVA
jgi:hypothetical protein